MSGKKYSHQKDKYSNVKKGFQKLFNLVKTSSSDEGSKREQIKLYNELINLIKSEDIPNFIENFYGPGKTLLFDLKRYGFESQFNELLTKYKINPNVQDLQTGDTLLNSIVAKGDLKLIDKLLDDPRVDPNIPNKFGQTAIFFAPTFEIFQKLLRVGADINKRDINGITPLMNAIINARYSMGIDQNYLQIANFLINKDSVNVIDNRGWNALFYAIDKNIKEVIEKLIEKEVNLNWQDKNGKTALMLAVEKNDLNLVKKLIENGASLTVSDNSKNLAIDYARKISNKNIVDYLVEKTQETVEILAEAQTVLIGSLNEDEIPESWEEL